MGLKKKQKTKQKNPTQNLVEIHPYKKRKNTSGIINNLFKDENLGKNPTRSSPGNN